MCSECSFGEGVLGGKNLHCIWANRVYIGRSSVLPWLETTYSKWGFSVVRRLLVFHDFLPNAMVLCWIRWKRGYVWWTGKDWDGHCHEMIWEYSIEMDFKETGCEDCRWMELAQHYQCWTFRSFNSNNNSIKFLFIYMLT
jgi:hypothetical protein